MTDAAALFSRRGGCCYAAGQGIVAFFPDSVCTAMLCDIGAPPALNSVPYLQYIIIASLMAPNCVPCFQHN
jgi:hypothetical protein